MILTGTPHLPFNIFTATVIFPVTPRTPVAVALATLEKAPLPIILITLMSVLFSSQFLVLGTRGMYSLGGVGDWALPVVVTSRGLSSGTVARSSFVAIGFLNVISKQVDWQGEIPRKKERKTDRQTDRHIDR